MRRSILVRLATPEPARLWTGHGDLDIPADDVELQDGARYLGGAGLISGFDEVEQLINGIADRLDIVLGGVTPSIVRLANEEAAGVIGATLDVGVVWFDQGWQITDVEWAARYRADKLGINRGEGQRSITLSLGTDDTGRSRSPTAFWTAADQRRRSPTDLIFDHVAGINAGTSRIFAPNG